MKDNKDVASLSHTAWRCQYHVVFAPKYRRMVIYGQIKKISVRYSANCVNRKELKLSRRKHVLTTSIC